MRRRRMQINGRCEINGRCKTAVYFFATGSLKTDCGILGIRRRKDKIRGLPLRRDGILQAATAGEKAAAEFYEARDLRLFRISV